MLDIVPTLLKLKRLETKPVINKGKIMSSIKSQIIALLKQQEEKYAPFKAAQNIVLLAWHSIAAEEIAVVLSDREVRTSIDELISDTFKDGLAVENSVALEKIKAVKGKFENLVRLLDILALETEKINSDPELR
jgi:hypothetical protein